jgi:hypothetical protein
MSKPHMRLTGNVYWNDSLPDGCHLNIPLLAVSPRTTYVPYLLVIGRRAYEYMPDLPKRDRLQINGN